MQVKRKVPNRSYLNEAFFYDSDSGFLYWKERPVSHFDDEHRAQAWNTKFAGNRCGTVAKLNHTKYIQVKIKNKRYLAHRLIYFMFKDGDQSLYIDHIDGDGLNNRIKNLRLVTCSENGKNTRVSSANTSGVPGVTWDKGAKRWGSFVWSNKKRIELGRFKTIDEAITARKLAEPLYGYHPNHGRQRCP